jgi:phage terminase large subunit-like protein
MVTTTPKPLALLRDIIKKPSTVMVRGSSYENIDNLSPRFIEDVIRAYEDTTIGQQEIHAVLMGSDPRALWNRDMISRLRGALPPLKRIVVAVDPAVSAEEDSNETGIIVAGIGECRCKGEPEDHGFILDDLSGKMAPKAWASMAVRGYDNHEADRVVAEVNQGGDLVETTLRAIEADVSYRAVRAAKGKRTRAEPIAALYEKGKVHHVGVFRELEDQLVNWVPGLGDSPDRLDALVWGLTDLFFGKTKVRATWGKR